MIHNKYIKIIGPIFVIVLMLAALFGYFFGNKYLESIAVKSIFPQDKTLNVNLYQEIIITFNKNTPEHERNLLTYSIVPNIETSFLWQNKQNLIIKAQPHFDFSTKYILTIYYLNNNLKTVEFTTVDPQNMSTEEQIRYQSQADFEFGQKMQEIYDEKPWLEKLPLDTDDYTVVYDFEKNQLRVRIKKLLTPEERSNIQQEINSKLTEIGIPQNMSIYWLE